MYNYTSLIQTFDLSNKGEADNLHLSAPNEEYSIGCYTHSDRINQSFYIFSKDYTKHTTTITFTPDIEKEIAEKIYAGHAYIRQIGIPLLCNRHDLFEEYIEYVDKMQELKTKEYKLQSKLQKNKTKQEAIFKAIDGSKDK